MAELGGAAAHPIRYARTAHILGLDLHLRQCYSMAINTLISIVPREPAVTRRRTIWPSMILSHPKNQPPMTVRGLAALQDRSEHGQD